jgi:adenosylcobinamide-phosphate synthase
VSFFAVLFALILEQARPLPQKNPVHQAIVAWSRWAGRNLDAGGNAHAWMVWTACVALPALGAWAVYVLALQFNVLAALAWNVAMLYVTLGFRQFSHHFTEIREALDRGDEEAARQQLAQWRHLDASELPRVELLRHVIEHSLLAAHRHVFGAFFWFIALSAIGLGPAGAVLYRAAEFARRYWTYKVRAADESAHERVAELAQYLFSIIDHVPARLTAFGFAVVGNFEDAVAAWRRDAGLWQQANEGIVLAAAAGALGVRLGGRQAPGLSGVHGGAWAADSRAGDLAGDAVRADGSTAGAAPSSAHLDSLVGLVWRSVVLWMLLVALLTVARLLG